MMMANNKKTILLTMAMTMLFFFLSFPVVSSSITRKLDKKKKSKSGSKDGKTKKSKSSDDVNNKKFYSWTSGSLEILPTSEKILNVVAEVEGNIDGHFSEVTTPLLTNEECSRLRDYAEGRLQEHLVSGEELVQYGADVREDFRFHLSVDELLRLVSLNSIKAMYNAFKAHDSNYRVSEILIRRSHHETNDKHIRYHQDGDRNVMHVWLNDDSLNGGNLYYLNRTGTTKFDTGLGTAAFHSNGIVQ